MDRFKAIERSQKLMALALRNDAHWEALSALRMAQKIVSQHDLVLVVADPNGRRTDPSASSASGCPWAPALVERWASRALPHCVEAVRLLAEANYPLPGAHLNKLAGVPDHLTCVLGGLQRWATVHGHPRPLSQDEFGGWFFVSPAIRAAFSHALVA